MSALLGLNMPQNSVGKLPLDYMRIHDEDKIEAKLANALQIHEQYKSMKAKRTNTMLPLTSFSRPDPFTLDLEQVLDKIDAFKKKAKYAQALDLTENLHEESLQALFHYQRYHRSPLYLAISLTYVGFIFYIILILLKVSTLYGTIFSFNLPYKVFKRAPTLDLTDYNFHFHSITTWTR